MRLQSLLPLIGMLFLASPSHAEDTPKADEPAKDAAKEEAAPEKTHFSSADNRQGKMASVVLEEGFAIAPLPTSGFGASYFVTPDLLAELSYVSGEFKLADISISGSLLELRAQYFIGNSFYVIGGFGQRKIGFDAKLDASAAGGNKIPVSVETTSTGLSLGVGNHWQWGGFTLGCQWLGYFLPLSSSGDTDLDVAGANDKDKKDLQDSIDGLAKTPTYQALRLAAGWSF